MKYRVTIQKEGKQNEIRNIEAPSRFDVYEKIRNEGGIVVSLTELHGLGLVSFSKYNITFGTGISEDRIITMTKNLSGMLHAGLSLSRALGVLGKQSGNKRLKAIVLDIEESVRKGESFHEALDKHSRIFSSLYRAMVRAGEESGTLVESLSIISLQMERTSRLMKKVKGAMIYPAIILVAILGVSILMMIYVVPTLTKTFTSLNVTLPLATRVIVAISNFMVGNILLVLISMIAVLLVIYFYVRSKRGGAQVLHATLYIPVINELIRETYAARAARTISSLLSSGVPVLRVLEITEDVVGGGNIFGKIIRDSKERVKRGEPLSAAFVGQTRFYPVFMNDMISVGEETGNLAEMLKQVAEFYEEDVEQKTKDLSTIIEPVIMLIVGVGVGIFSVAIIAPIYSLSSAI